MDVLHIVDIAVESDDGILWRHLEDADVDSVDVKIDCFRIAFAINGSATRPAYGDGISVLDFLGVIIVRHFESRLPAIVDMVGRNRHGSYIAADVIPCRMSDAGREQRNQHGDSNENRPCYPREVAGGGCDS